MQAAQIAGDGAAQLRVAEVVRIEGVGRGERGAGGFAYRQRRRAVGFAEPELEHIGAAHARVGDFADLGRIQIEHRGAR